VEPHNERRKEPRLVTNLPVMVTVLGIHPQEAISGQVLDMSGGGVLLGLRVSVPCGSPVKVEGDDMLLLGEVCRSEADAEQYRVAVIIRHFVDGLAELERMNAALLDRQPSATPIER
jgi:hypothetical protein